MSEIVRCNHLTKRYGNLVALNRVNFTLESGKIVGLLGPNGSGKTTLIKLLNGLLALIVWVIVRISYRKTNKKNAKEENKEST